MRIMRKYTKSMICICLLCLNIYLFKAHISDIYTWYTNETKDMTKDQSWYENGEDDKKQVLDVASLLTPKTFSSAYVSSHWRYNETHILQSPSEQHQIMWWNEPNWMKSAKWNSYCVTSLCEYSNCVMTVDKNQFNKSSAVIISIVDGGASTVPISRLKRNPKQAWIFFSLESPMSFWNRAFVRKEWHNVFNWSMTYRRDADIFIPYGFLKPKMPSLSKNYTDIFHKKTKQVAWIVSHCSTQGKREEYIEKLRKYIPVDIYGDCGTKLPDKILYDILPTYKFYIGFENAFCKDYFTEKFFHYLKYDLIVVVRGLTDYNKHFPENTFVNTAQFASIESLGQYLVKLGNNEKEYIEYLKKKDQYTVFERWDSYCNGLCSICEKVNNINYNRRSYGNIFKWTGTCESPTDLD